MSQKPKNVTNHWIKARERHRLSHAHIQIACEAPEPSIVTVKPWNLSPPGFFVELYFKRFGNGVDTRMSAWMFSSPSKASWRRMYCIRLRIECAAHSQGWSLTVGAPVEKCMGTSRRPNPYPENVKLMRPRRMTFDGYFPGTPPALEPFCCYSVPANVGNLW